MTDELTFGSGFTGVGGFDRGFELAGMRCLWQSEIDGFCQRVLEKHWPDVLRVPDIRDVRAGVVPEVDVFCGGSPCQDLSTAGLRAGLDGDRSGLFFEFARVADELVRPGGWIVFENVPGLLPSPGRDRETGVDRTGRDFAIVLATLADIGFHDLAWRVLDSRYFGVPQRRRRVYIVGRRAVGGSAREVLLEPESGGGDFAPGGEARQRVAASLSRGSAGPGVSAPGRRQEDDTNIVNALDRQSQHALTAEGFDASEDGTGRGTPLVPQPGGLAISGPLGGGNDGIGRRSEDDPNLVCASSNAHGVRASPGLPGRVDDPKPDGPRYSAMGNAVTVNVLQWIGERIVIFEGRAS